MRHARSLACRSHRGGPRGRRARVRAARAAWPIASPRSSSRPRNNQGNVDLLNQVTQLQVRSAGAARAARGTAAAERAAQADAAATSTSTSTAASTGSKAAAAPAAAATARRRAGSAAAAPPPPATRAPAVHGDAGTLAQGADERAAYDAAFDALKAGDYAESAQPVPGSSCSDYPNGTYAPNALYWLGESYYVTQNYALAQQQFQRCSTAIRPTTRRRRAAQGRPVAVRPEADGRRRGHAGAGRPALSRHRRRAHRRRPPARDPAAARVPLRSRRSAAGARHRAALKSRT